MLVLAALVSALVVQHPPAAPLDVSTLTVGPSTTIAAIDLGRLKGDLRRLAWSPDGQSLYIQTGEGKPPDERVRHYTVAASGGEPTPVEENPNGRPPIGGSSRTERRPASPR
jgi:glucose/arabinose dehydrogenase